MENLNTAEGLWRTYLSLTREMAKFLARRELELFFELIDQREKLQLMLDELPADDFRSTDAGRKVIAVIREENRMTMHNLRCLLNATRQQQTVSQAYEGPSGPGGLMDFKK